MDERLPASSSLVPAQPTEALPSPSRPHMEKEQWYVVPEGSESIQFDAPNDAVAAGRRGGCGGCAPPPCNAGRWGVSGLRNGWYHLPFLTLNNATARVGVQGFKNASNLDADGSFGFLEGLNYGAPLPLFPGWGFQVGGQLLQNNISGANFTTADRQQSFLTTGVFRRRDFGWQCGVVFDLLVDEWYADRQLEQVRGEISFKLPRRHEFGYRFASGTSTDRTVSPILAGQTDIWEATDWHRVFYRRRFATVPGLEAEFFTGLSANSDGLLGMRGAIPLTRGWDVSTSMTYLIPEESNRQGGSEQEAWNIGMSLVYHFGCDSGRTYCNPYRPLFDVADNGTLITQGAGAIPPPQN